MTWRVSVPLATCLLLPAGAFAQGSTVQGQVRDSTLGIVPDVRVTISGPALSTPITTLTAKAGRYEFTNVPDGVYDVVFDTSTVPSCPSFPHSGVAQRRVVVASGGVTQIDIRLPSGPLGVMVEAGADNRVAEVARVRSTPAAPQSSLLER